MNSYPPLPPFFPSQHRLPGHGPTPAQEHRRRVDAIILPLEARVAQRIFPALRPVAPAPVAPAAAQACPAAAGEEEPSASLLGRALSRLLRALAGG